MGDSGRRFWCWILNNLPLADCLIASYTSKSEKLYVWRANILCDCALLGLGTATCKLAFPFLSIALCWRQFPMYAPGRNNFAVLGVLEVQCRGHFIAQMRKLLGEPRGDQPRDVIPGPSAGGPRGDHPRDVIPGPSAGDSLAAGNIDLPEEVANDELDDLLEDVTTATPKKEDVATDELDDLFVDVKTASPKKEDRSLAKTLRKKRKAAGGTRAPGLGAPADGVAHPGVLPLVEAMAVVAIKDLVTKFFKKNLSQETMPKLIKDHAQAHQGQCRALH